MRPEGAAGRRVRQPGPAAAERIMSRAGPLEVVTFMLAPGATLLEAVAGPMNRAGLRAAGVALTGARLRPLTYVVPAVAPDADHAAYYSDTRRWDEETVLGGGTATFGSREGAGFMHCHASWQEGSGRVRAGHLLPDACVVAAATEARAWGTREVAMLSGHDPETNFTLFRPDGGPGTGGCIVACIRPGEDLTEAIEALCARHRVTQARVRSGVGSVVGAIFEDGRRVEEHPTEFYVTAGLVRPGPDGAPRAEITVGLADVRGALHEGRLARGWNPVLITCELVMTLEENERRGHPPETRRAPR